MKLTSPFNIVKNKINDTLNNETYKIEYNELQQILYIN